MGIGRCGVARLFVAAGISFAINSTCVASSDFRVLHSFCVSPEGYCDGELAFRGLVMDNQKNLFGVTYYGGEFGHGTVFELKRERHRHYKFLSLHSFGGEDGKNPYSSLVVDTQGNLYGVTLLGGAKNKGVVFEVSPGAGKKGRKWTEKVLHSFCIGSRCADGANPASPLSYLGFERGELYDGVSPLFGTASAGGVHNGGTAFTLVKAGDEWQETVIHQFCSKGGSECSDGWTPETRLLPDQFGNLYGTTDFGGNTNINGGGGTAFELLANDNWSETILYDFCSQPQCSDGFAPFATLIRDAAGNLYGATGAGGVPNESCGNSFGCGTIFKLAPDGENWTMNVLHYFCQQAQCVDGGGTREGLVFDTKDNLFGTAGGGENDDGIIFELSGTDYKVLYNFCSAANCTDGSNPFSQLIVSKSGRLFGTTENGGENERGVVFELRPPD
jgi:uncharacterized repeat protein (TIGR03803 family)